MYLLKVHAGLGMRELFLLGGALTAVGAIPLAFMPTIRAKRPKRTPLGRVLTKGYRLFCGLELLDGMRKQVPAGWGDGGRRGRGRQRVVSAPAPGAGPWVEVATVIRKKR